MLGLFCILAFLCFQISFSYGYGNCFNNCEDNFDQPLFLTNYIEKDDLHLARQLSRVGKLPHVPDIESYSGFFTVNKEFNSNIFFWFFPAMNENASAPVLLWLNGGPGASSLFGLFVEHGPYAIQANLTAKLRNIHWTMMYHLLYVDNPTGTGFSFTDDVRGYVTNENEMADDLFIFLQQFFYMFSEYGENEFYITGESYAGKYIPSLAHKIYKMGPYVNFKLTGIAIGNGLCELETMLEYSDFLYNLGLIDENQAKEMQSLSDVILKNIQSENYAQALFNYDKLIAKFFTYSSDTVFNNFTGYTFYYNYLLPKEPDDFNFYEDYVRLPEIKRALHVGNLPFRDLSDTVKQYLLTDIAKSVKPNVTVIMDNYRVLFYSGQLDVKFTYRGTVNFLRSVPWKYADEYKGSKRRIWYLKGTQEISGYVHNVRDFYEVLVRNVGHMVPYDNPAVGFDLISRFINREGYD